jgi:hypothetical protein
MSRRPAGSPVLRRATWDLPAKWRGSHTSASKWPVSPRRSLQAFSQIGNLSSAPDANNPYLSQIAGRYSDVGSAPASSIAAPSVLGSSFDPRTASLNQYIDPNLALELNPTLAAIQRQAQIAKNGPGGVGSNATAAGAFGDARQGVEAAGVDEAAMRQAAAATGTAYQNAFTNAANLRGLDISNLINTQRENAALRQQQLMNELQSGGALQNLAYGQTGQQMSLNQALLGSGNQQQQLAQQLANLPYINSQGQLQFGTAQLSGLDQALLAARSGAPMSTTTQTTAPNNAGWALGGAVLGSNGFWNALPALAA